MLQSRDLSLREAADELGIEPWRLARLARYLKLDPLQSRLAREEVQRIKQRDSVEDRYAATLQLLLANVRQTVDIST